MRRSTYWREELAAEFQSIEFRREYFLGLVFEEQMEVPEALERAIKAMGIKEFSKAAGMPASNVSRVLASSDYKLSTLLRFLEVFGVGLSVEELAG